jgi:CSLREA domain-containing protein
MKGTTSFRFVLVSRVLLANLALSGAATPVVLAASFTVNTQSDTPNAVNGQCADENGDCSLRAAIEASNALPAFHPTVITLPSGSYTLTMGQLVINHSLFLNGAGSNSTFIDGNNSSRVFEVLGATNPIVSFFGVTIQNADGVETLVAPGGGGISIGHGAYLALSNSVVRNNKGIFGGGIGNGGYLQILSSTIQDNSTPLSSGGGVTESGGGIFNFATANVTIDKSTISGNKATRAGGIRNAGGHLEITNSTISGNKANTRGGGIMNFGTAFIAYSTIVFNEANVLGGADEDTFGGGIYNDADATTGVGGTVSMGNTILAMNTDRRSRSDHNYSPDGYSKSPATFTSFRGNLVGILNANANLSDSIFGDTRFDQVGTPDAPLDPQLHPLADNGGPTMTHALLPGSPAIDRGTGVTSATFFDCPATDQRGARRPAGKACDVGAFEFGADFGADAPTDL